MTVSLYHHSTHTSLRISMGRVTTGSINHPASSGAPLGCCSWWRPAMARSGSCPYAANLTRTSGNGQEAESDPGNRQPTQRQAQPAQSGSRKEDIAITGGLGNRGRHRMKLGYRHTQPTSLSLPGDYRKGSGSQRVTWPPRPRPATAGGAAREHGGTPLARTRLPGQASRKPASRCPRSPSHQAPSEHPRSQTSAPLVPAADPGAQGGAAPRPRAQHGASP